MNVAADLFLDQNFARTLVDAFPCGLLVVDEQGRIQIVNDLLERALKIDQQASIGKATGNVLGCLHASEHPKGCGFAECCQFCEIQKLTSTPLHSSPLLLHLDICAFDPHCSFCGTLNHKAC